MHGGRTNASIPDLTLCPLSIPVEQQRATGPHVRHCTRALPARRDGPSTDEEPTMALTTCRGCGQQISTTASTCPACGAKVPRSRWLWAALGLAGAALALVLVPNRSSDEERRAKDRHAIEECHAQAERPTIDPGARGFMAGACDLMEAQFVDRWGEQP